MSTLFVAWRPAKPEQSGWRPVGRLEHDGGLYRFCYTRGAQKPSFQPFRGMERLDHVYEAEELFPLFSNRLLPKSRPEYEAFLRWGGFSIENPPDPIGVLGVTEGIRQTDAVEVFPCPEPAADGCYFNKFFLHGICWMPPMTMGRINKLRQGERLRLLPDPQNENDPQAVAVRTELEPTFIGYVPRYLAHDALQLMRQCDLGFVEVSVNRVNRDAPLQNRVLCHMHACWPDGFRPCGGEDFLPIPQVELALHDV